jgi:DNA primase
VAGQAMATEVFYNTRQSARLSGPEVDRLRNQVSIQRLAEARGVVLERRGEELVGRCPFHEGERDSLVVVPEENRWYCLGRCGGGSPIEWVMCSEGVSHRHAVEMLRAGVTTGSWGRPPRKGTITRLPSPFPADVSDGELLDRVVRFYTHTLRESPDALDYLERRCLRHPEVIDRFRLGYANRTIGYRIPNKQRQAGEAVRSKLQAIGVLRDSGHEHFRGSVVVPVFDEDGEIVQLYGRRVGRARDRGSRDGTGHLWLPGPRRGVWNRDALATSSEIIICQSIIDALTFWCAGYRNVTAAWGPAGFTDEHREAFRAYGVSRVLIAFARTDDAERAASELADYFTDSGIECFRVVFPRDYDANAVATEVASPAEALGRAIRNATWMGAGPAPALRGSSPLAAADPGRVPVREEGDGEESTAADDQSEALCERAAETGGEQDHDVEETVRADGALVAPRRPASRFRPVTHPPASYGPNLPTAVEGAPAEATVAPLPVPPASPMPAPVAAIDAEVVGGELRVRLAERRWRVRGLDRATSYDLLRVNLLVSRSDDRAGDRFHVDTLDLYSARARAAFVKAAAEELGLAADVVRRDLGRVLLACEERAAEAVRAAQTPAAETVTLSAEEETAALGLLRDPNLVGRIVADFEAVGMVGETTNALVGYLAAISRKLDHPLAVVVQSTTAAGKSALLDAVLSFVPAEERIKLSAMTGQSLFYMGEADLAHKLLAVAEEEGASRASYALKLLQSEGELSIASTGKDSTGRLAAHTYRVAGPVAIFLTTTAIDIDEELLNRCIVLTVDEERDQTRAIHAVQRERQTLPGLLADAERAAVVKVHQDAQRLLEPVLVANPYAPQLSFADERTRTRRDHLKYLGLIRAVALLHQHQRPRRSVRHRGGEVAYIEVTPSDIALANRLAHETLGRSLDELAPQTRRLLGILTELVETGCQNSSRAAFRFTRRDVRDHCGWSDFQVRVHLGQLVEMEYVLVHRGGRGQSFVYELLYDGGGTDGRPHLVGLTDPATLTPCGYDPDIEHVAADSEGPSSGQRALIEAAPSGNGKRRRPATTTPPADVPDHEHVGTGTSNGPIPKGER